MAFLQPILGLPVSDPEEEASVVFSQAIPSQSLGFIDSNASDLTITIADREYTVHQSRGLLTSDRKQGTTGAVVWKVTPLFATWISGHNFLFEAGYLTRHSTAVELGTGVSGLVALSLGQKIGKYIATDQDYVIRMLKQNIADNLPVASAAKGKKSKRKFTPSPSSNISTLELDWETDSVAHLSDGSGVDVVIACDCIYNDSLIEPLNTTCAQICRLRSSDSDSSSEKEQKPTLCLVAQQLRSFDVFEAWLKSFHRLFRVWQVPDALLTEGLREGSGFIVHVGIVR